MRSTLFFLSFVNSLFILVDQMECEGVVLNLVNRHAPEGDSGGSQVLQSLRHCQDLIRKRARLNDVCFDFLLKTSL